MVQLRTRGIKYNTVLSIILGFLLDVNEIIFHITSREALQIKIEMYSETQTAKNVCCQLEKHFGPWIRSGRVSQSADPNLVSTRPTLTEYTTDHVMHYITQYNILGRVCNVLVLNDPINFSSRPCHDEDDCDVYSLFTPLVSSIFSRKTFQHYVGREKVYEREKKKETIHYIFTNRIRRVFVFIVGDTTRQIIFSHDTALYIFMRFTYIHNT